MKKFAIIASVAAGFLGLAAAAEAGYYTTRVVGYDRCGRPIVRQVYVETCQPRSYGHGYSGYYSRPSYGYSRGYSSCPPSYGYSHSYRSSRSRCR